MYFISCARSYRSQNLTFFGKINKSVQKRPIFVYEMLNSDFDNRTSTQEMKSAIQFKFDKLKYNSNLTRIIFLKTTVGLKIS